MKKLMFMGLVLAAAGCNADEGNGIYHFKAGQFDVYMLEESRRPGNAGILVGADDSILRQYITEAGFDHSANAFLIKAPGQNILIDCGTGAGGIIIDKLRSLGVEPADINAVLITHLHGDHFGSLQDKGRAVFPNAKIYLSQKELEYFTVTNVNRGAAAALAPYGSNIVTFDPSQINQTLRELLPGISPVAAYGHTPGHTIFLIESDGQKLLIIGDLLHVALVQFPVPDISATYDMNQGEAAAVRRQVLDYAARNGIPVGGMHIVYPAAGRVDAEGTGFKFTPMD